MIIERDFVRGIDEWKELANVEDIDLDLDTIDQEVDDQVFPVEIVPKSEYYRPEIQDAIEAEISKYKSFEAFEEVPDEGQKSVPTRWVVTKQKLDGKNQPFKARMCIRGDLERGKEYLRADAPTASKDALKLVLMLAANEGFKVQSGDIKSAFLQGAKIDRELFVRPPQEANVNGKLWLLMQGAYGILDGGRLFYLRLSKELEDLGMHRVHSDGALFTYVKNGKFHGIIVANVDDLILAGDDVFEEHITAKLKQIFKFSKVEGGTFTYCGNKIVTRDNGTIELDQNEYIDTLEPLDDFKGDVTRELSENAKKQVRGKIGELLWISLLTRPDISFDVNVLSSQISQGTVETAKNINKLIKKAKASRNILKFVRLGDASKLTLKIYSDASYCNQDGKTRSTEGRVLLLTNEETKLVNVVSWKTKKIARVCRSVKSAETRALEEAVDDAINTARLVKEIYTGKIDLKSPDQIPVEAFTDSKSLWESLHNTRQCEDKILRCSIAGIKELIDLKMLKDVHWVSTKQQLADCMTKAGKKLIGL